MLNIISTNRGNFYQVEGSPTVNRTWDAVTEDNYQYVKDIDCFNDYRLSNGQLSLLDSVKEYLEFE